MKYSKQDRKKQKRNGIIGIAFLLLFFAIVGSYMFFYLEEKHVPEYLDIVIDDAEITQVTYIQMQEEDEQKVSISWQSNSEGNGMYLFLPSFARCDDMKIRAHISGKNSQVLFGKWDEEAKCMSGQLDISEKEEALWKDMGTGVFMIDVDGVQTDFTICKSENIPCLWLDLDHEDGLDYIQEDKENSSTGQVVITTQDGQVDYQGKVQEFRGHGNTSWARPKRSFKLYLEQKNSLLGMDRCKKWVLISNVVDRSQVRNKFFTDMAQSCGLENTMDCEWVDLYIDGDYRGLYLLSEKIDINSENFDIGDLEKETKEMNDEPLDSFEPYQRVYGTLSMQGWNIPKEPKDFHGGYIIEADYLERFNGEPSKFCTSQEELFVVKSPEYATAYQIEYIAGFVQEFENAVVSPDGKNERGLHYSAYIDLESFAKRYVLDEISKNIDSGYSSYYCYKPQKENKLYAGPIWDYDTALGNYNGWGDESILTNPKEFYVNQHNWAEFLYKQPEFYEQALYEYGRYFEPYLKNSEKKLDEYEKEIAAAADMNGVRWGVPEWREEIAKMESFLQERTAFLSSQWRK